MDLYHSAEFGTHVQSLLDKFHCPGISIALVQNHTVVSSGYGLVHLDPPQPMTPDTLFDVASTSKSLTAASVALLVDDDDKYPNVTYEATMSSLLPDDFVMSEESYTAQITVEDVLSHRTGLAPHDWSYLGPGSSHPDNAKSITRNLRNLVIASPLRTKWSYCNMMYTVASHLVETLSQASFSDFLQEHFFKPLGMNSTTLDPSRARANGLGDRITPGYLWNDDNKTYTSFSFPDCPEAQGATGVVTSVNDYIKYISAIMNQEPPFTEEVYQGLIRTRAFEDADYTERSVLTSSVLYGVGWEIFFYRGHMVVSHTGSNPGARIAHFFIPSIKFGAVIMTNADGGGTVRDILQSELIDDALKTPKEERPEWEKLLGDRANGGDGGDSDEGEELRERLCPDNKNTTEPQTKSLSSYTGSYKNPGYHYLIVDTEDDKLHINGSDRSMTFQIEFEHVCNQTQYIAHVFTDGENGDALLAAEFEFDGDRAVKLGIAFEDTIDELIWFDRE